jgi:hypothetical protein
LEIVHSCPGCHDVVSVTKFKAIVGTWQSRTRSDTFTLTSAGASFGTKVPLGGRLNMVDVRGRHLLPEDYVVAPSSPAEPGPALVLVLSVDGVGGVFAVVVAWPSSDTDVVLSSTSGSCC